MSFIASFLLQLVTNKFAQQLAIIALENAATKSTNTVDDQVVAIVRQAVGNRANPIQRVVGK